MYVQSHLVATKTVYSSAVFILYRSELCWRGDALFLVAPRSWILYNYEAFQGWTEVLEVYVFGLVEADIPCRCSFPACMFIYWSELVAEVFAADVVAAELSGDCAHTQRLGLVAGDFVSRCVVRYSVCSQNCVCLFISK